MNRDYLEDALSSVEIPGIDNPLESMTKVQKQALFERARNIVGRTEKGETLKQIATALYPVSVAVIDGLINWCNGELSNEVYTLRNFPIQMLVDQKYLPKEDQERIKAALKGQEESQKQAWVSSDEDVVPELRLPSRDEGDDELAALDPSLASRMMGFGFDNNTVSEEDVRVQLDRAAKRTIIATTHRVPLQVIRALRVVLDQIRIPTLIRMTMPRVC